MTGAKDHQFDAVLVWKLDRFGRSLRHLMNSLAELKDCGVTFVSLKDNFDLTTAAGRAMFGMIGVMAEFERELIQERVKAGLRHAKSKGKTLGQPRKAVDLASVRRRNKAGASLGRIASDLGVSRSLLWNRLRTGSKP